MAVSVHHRHGDDIASAQKSVLSDLNTRVMGQGVADIVGIFRLYGFLYRISVNYPPLNFEEI